MLTGGLGTFAGATGFVAGCAGEELPGTLAGGLGTLTGAAGLLVLLGTDAGLLGALTPLPGAAPDVLEITAPEVSRTGGAPAAGFIVLDTLGAAYTGVL